LEEWLEEKRGGCQHRKEVMESNERRAWTKDDGKTTIERRVR